MTGLPLASDRPAESATVTGSALAALAVSLSAALAVAWVAFAIWVSPLYLSDGPLDRAGSPAILALPPATVHAVSASVVQELFIGPGTFAQTIPGPDGQPVLFFGPAEASHLRDVQLLVRLVTVLALVGMGLLAAGAVRIGRRPWFWHAVARGAGGLAAGLVAVGVIFIVAFEPAFTLFHLIFFPEGNWSFDPLEARMVQLYNTAFWEEVVLVYFLLAIALAVVAWVGARALARRAEAR